LNKNDLKKQILLKNVDERQRGGSLHADLLEELKEFAQNGARRKSIKIQDRNHASSKEGKQISTSSSKHLNSNSLSKAGSQVKAIKYIYFK